MKLVLGLFLGLSISAFSFAGNGSSGGGHIYGDKLNPWFLQNTTTVNYCVEISPEFSQLSEARVLELVQKSFSFWKNVFQNYSTNFSNDMQAEGFDIKVGTQQFIYESKCSSTIDLKFQFGFLSDDQKKTINHKQLIGLAERTSYDNEQMKGKGFIYLAAESGEFRPSSPNLHATPWSYANNLPLEYVLAHEIGHIFGLQDGFYDDVGLMSAHLAEEITSKAAVKFLAIQKYHPATPFGCDDRLEGEFDVSYSQTSAPSFPKKLNRKIKSNNLSQFLGLGTKYDLRVSSSSQGLKVTDLNNNKVIGTIKYSKANETESTENDAISVYFTKEQKLFPKLPRRFLNTYQPFYLQTTSRGFKNEELLLTNGNSMKVFVKFDSQCFASVGAEFENEIYFDIFWGM